MIQEPKTGEGRKIIAALRAETKARWKEIKMLRREHHKLVEAIAFHKQFQIEARAESTKVDAHLWKLIAP